MLSHLKGPAKTGGGNSQWHQSAWLSGFLALEVHAQICSVFTTAHGNTSFGGGEYYGKKYRSSEKACIPVVFKGLMFWRPQVNSWCHGVIFYTFHKFSQRNKGSTCLRKVLTVVGFPSFQLTESSPSCPE